MRAVNLLPRDEQRERLQGARPSLFLAVGGVVVVTALAMLLAATAAGDVSTSRTELRAVETEIAGVPKTADAVVTQGTIVRERADRVAALSAALSTRVPFDRLLREISFVLPADAWLTQLTASAPTGPAPGAVGAAPPPPTATTAAGVSIEGATYSHDSVARVLARLSVVPSLENVELTSSSRVEPQKSSRAAKGSEPQGGPRKPFVTFIVSASLRSGAAR